MKIELSIPSGLFEAAEMLRKQLRVSRNRLFATALRDFLTKHEAEKATDRLNLVYGVEDSRLDGTTRRLQARVLKRTKWSFADRP